MGSTAQIVGRVTAGIATGGASEAIRAASKPIGRAVGVDKRYVDIGLNYGRDAIAGATTDMAVQPNNALATAGARLAEAPAAAAPAQTDPVKPGQTDAERERDARLAADRRKKDYQNLGRSSTILTGPGGLAGSGSGTAKTLLGT
jgi:hypothetical protein